MIPEPIWPALPLYKYDRLVKARAHFLEMHRACRPAAGEKSESSVREGKAP